MGSFDSDKMLELIKEASMLEIYAVLAIAKLSADADGLIINNVACVQAPDPAPEPSQTPLEMLCEAALADAAREKRRTRMRCSTLEKQRMIELAERLRWEWGGGAEREAEREGVRRFCAERPGRVDVEQFVEWMGRSRKKYQRAKPN